MFLTGTIWGSVIYFAPYVHTIDFYFLMMATGFAFSSAAVATLGSIFSVFLSFSMPLLLIINIALITSDKPGYFETGITMAIGVLFLTYTAFNHRNSFSALIQKNKEIKRTQLDIIERLGIAGEYRDSHTGLHIKRMSHFSYLLALASGLNQNQADNILAASPMHDVGKIGIPDSILLKPGKLDEKEWEIMKTHPTIGHAILQDHDSELMKLAAVISLYHHEKWDGTGYPSGFSGENIPFSARIVTICDVFDALTSKRPYKEAWPTQKALAYIKQQSGKHFDPTLTQHFIRISPQIIQFMKEHRDSNTD